MSILTIYWVGVAISFGFMNTIMGCGIWKPSGCWPYVVVVCLLWPIVLFVSALGAAQ